MTDYSPEAIAKRGIECNRIAVEGLRKIQELDGINFADLFEQAGNKEAAKEFRETVDNPDYKVTQ